MLKKCPFRKRKIVIDYDLHGVGGFPMAKQTREDFDECIGSKCMAYEERTCYTEDYHYTIKYCYLCGKDPD